MSEQHIVYEAELVGIILRAYPLKTARTHISGPISIAADIMAAFKAAHSHKVGQAQYLLDSFHDATKRLTEKYEDITITLNITITLRRVPGHQYIPGNEECDIQAKEAAEKEDVVQQITHPLGPHPMLPTLLSASTLKQIHEATLKSTALA
jgi:ribonuclease HI